MATLVFDSDTALVLFAVVGLVATLAAIVRDTGIRRRSLGPAIS